MPIWSRQIYESDLHPALSIWNQTRSNFVNTAHAVNRSYLHITFKLKPEYKALAKSSFFLSLFPDGQFSINWKLWHNHNKRKQNLTPQGRNIEFVVFRKLLYLTFSTGGGGGGMDSITCWLLYWQRNWEFSACKRSDNRSVKMAEC